MLRVGIIGCGGIIERRHLPGLLELSDTVRITAMSDVSTQRVALLADRSGVGADGRYTDDSRESPSLKVVQRLRDAGAILALHEPGAMENAKAVLPESTGCLTYCQSPCEVAEGSGALVLLTAWPEYRELDFPRLRGLMSSPMFLDGRNLLDPAEMRGLGFDYSSMGRA